ncbi:MAG: hypothetical protein JST84_04885 [Acidobacteria bacterium]|nr:hypothetical protein [Acidobacteriota bacterium]
MRTEKERLEEELKKDEALRQGLRRGLELNEESDEELQRGLELEDENNFDLKEAPPSKKKSRKVAGLGLLLLLLLACLIFVWWLLKPSKVNVPVKAPMTDITSGKKENSEQARDAVLEDLKAITQPPPSANGIAVNGTVSPSPGSLGAIGAGGKTGVIDPSMVATAAPMASPGGKGTLQPGQPGQQVMGPPSSMAAPGQASVMAPPGGAHVMQNGQAMGQSATAGGGQREVVPYKVSFTKQKSWNREDGVPVPTPAASKSETKTNGATGNGVTANIEKMPGAKPVVRPTFGTQMPVQVVGVFFTLRQDSMVRLQVTRDIEGDDWHIKRGTIFIGKLSGNIADRAFITIKGYIDPESKGLVPLAGDLLGADGGPGIKGKKRAIGRNWWSVLDRIAERGVQALSGIYGRNQVIVAANPSQVYRDAGYGQNGSNQVREYLEVAASSPGFILVTDLPKDVGLGQSQLSEAYGQKSEPLTEAELADVMSSTDPRRIRAVIPRMPTELRDLAEQVARSLEGR